MGKRSSFLKVISQNDMEDIRRYEQEVLRHAYKYIQDKIKENKEIVLEQINLWNELRGYGYERLPDLNEIQNEIDRFNKDTKNLEEMLPQLWFGRIDFHHEGEEKAEVYYIGKKGYEGQGVRIIDWRTPLADLFYSHNNYYVAPGGLQKGKLQLVRQFDIEHDRLKKFNDNFIADQGLQKTVIKAKNDFFLEKLERRGEDHLKDVVVTIQPEQNEIIRHSKDRHLIIQGAAGTGKSIVLLHRAAYLLYDPESNLKYKEKDVLILAPSPLLIDQIAGILPDLGIKNVKQLTLEQFVWHIIGGKNNLEDLGFEIKPVASWKVPKERAIFAAIWAEIKGSGSLEKRLDELIEIVKATALNALEPVRISSRKNISVSQIKAFFQRENVKKQSYASQLKLFSEWLTEKIFEQIRGRQILDESEQEKYNLQASQIANSYLSKVIKPTHLFWQMAVPAYIATQKELYSALGMYVIPDEGLPTFTLDDLAALLYLYIKIQGIPQKFNFIMVDEAHSLSPFWLRLLKQFLRPGGSITLSGDAYQLGLSAWSLKKTYKAEDEDEKTDAEKWKWALEELGEGADVKTLSVVYRTTQPIAEYIGRLVAKMDDSYKFKSIGRPGEHVRAGLNIEQFIEFLRSHPDIKTAAIIVPTEEHARELKDRLSKMSLKGVSSLPVVLALTEAGGTEFDAVMVANTNAYASDTSALYTAASRALHYLIIG